MTDKPEQQARQPSEASVKNETEEVPTATISGRVSKEAGEPLGGAKVKCGDFSCDSGYTGEYTLTVKLTEKTEFTIDVSCNGYVSQSKKIEISPEDELSVDFIMEKGKSSIEVYVYDKKTRTPLPGAYVSIESQSAYTDQQGHLIFEGIDALKRYPITIYKDGYETETFLSDWVEPGKARVLHVHLKHKEAEPEPEAQKREEVEIMPGEPGYDYWQVG